MKGINRAVEVGVGRVESKVETAFANHGLRQKPASATITFANLIRMRLGSTMLNVYCNWSRVQAFIPGNHQSEARHVR